MTRILRFLDVVAIILLSVNWLAITDIIHKAENLEGELSFMNISYIIVLLILVVNIIFFSFYKCNKKNAEEK